MQKLIAAAALLFAAPAFADEDAAFTAQIEPLTAKWVAAFDA